MPKRTSPNQIQEPEDLNHLDDLVVDKRKGKRAHAKKERRDRHYKKLLIRQQLRALDDDHHALLNNLL
jgi:hypothetical protein